MNIRRVSADTYQSADTLQLLCQQGLVTSVRSIDRDPRPYDVLKTALYDGRVEIPAHDVLLGELLPWNGTHEPAGWTTLPMDPRT